jgi:hypothetical protein
MRCQGDSNFGGCPPVINMAIPNSLDSNLGFKNLKVAIFGDNLFNGSQVKLDETIFPLHQHNDGSGYIVLSDALMSRIRNVGHSREIKIELLISNNKKDWINTGKFLTFGNDAMLAEQLLGSLGSNISEFTFNNL